MWKISVQITRNRKKLEINIVVDKTLLMWRHPPPLTERSWRVTPPSRNTMRNYIREKRTYILKTTTFNPIQTEPDRTGRRTTTHFKSFIIDKPRGASPRRDYEDGISTNRIIFTLSWCSVHRE
jgi:predicted metal-dependent hydrolase